MADGVAITAGAGTTVSTDDRTEGHIQEVYHSGAAAGASAQTTISSTSANIIAARARRHGVLIVNNQTVAVYVDASGGTATTSHFRLDPGAAMFVPTVAAVTGITSAAYTASGDAKVHTIEVYNS